MVRGYRNVIGAELDPLHSFDGGVESCLLRCVVKYPLMVRELLPNESRHSSEVQANGIK